MPSFEFCHKLVFLLSGLQRSFFLRVLGLSNLRVRLKDFFPNGILQDIGLITVFVWDLGFVGFSPLFCFLAAILWSDMGVGILVLRVMDIFTIDRTVFGMT